MCWRKFVLVRFIKVYAVWYRWRSPGVEMFIDDHARLRRWRVVDKVITFMKDCYIFAEGVISMQKTCSCKTRLGFVDDLS